ncbi:hypothetical protein HORIV_45850 [Vreelandella olivaria]|uniref:Uncharacterized protein n=1 Tax=Vreelandella olivaria TaxID=390919 RepID=A0ABN5WYW3_9GAMM|nr:hypothetical protein HORIV_45850 [Halomonas olivaria]
MERDGQVLRDRRGAYALIDKLDLIKGKVLGHRDGFGFCFVMMAKARPGTAPTPNAPCLSR